MCNTTRSIISDVDISMFNVLIFFRYIYHIYYNYNTFPVQDLSLNVLSNALES